MAVIETSSLRNAWSVRAQTNTVAFPAAAHQLIGWYQILLFGDETHIRERWTTCPGLHPKARWPEVDLL